MLFSFIQSLSAELFGFQSNIGYMYNHLLAWIINIGIVVGHPINLSPAFPRHGLANIQHLYRRFLPFFFTHFITSPPTNDELSVRINLNQFNPQRKRYTIRLCISSRIFGSDACSGRGWRSFAIAVFINSILRYSAARKS